MKLKESVKVNGMRPELLIGLMAAQLAFAKHGHEMIITSLNDGKHGTNSYHYKGLAADLRTKHLPTEELKKAILDDIRASLNFQWDVLYENPGGDNQHFHIEVNIK